MRRITTAFLFIVAVTPAFPQGITDYYRPTTGPAKASRLNPDAAYSESERRGRRRSNWDRIMTRYGDAYIKSRWHVGVEGLTRTDRSQLDQSFNGLVSTESATALNWGATVGWVSRERWAVEAGYSQMPVHNTLLIQNGSSPLRFEFKNAGHSLVLRGKRRLTFGPRKQVNEEESRPLSRSGFWIGAGIWAIPGSRQTLNEMGFRGYIPRRRATPDTLSLTTVTQTSARWNAQAEVSLEYAVRLGGRAELALFLRRNWGFASAVTTSLAYRVNQNEPQRAVISSDGTGWGFGISFRFVHGHSYDVSRMPNIFNLKGNRPAGGKTESRKIGEEVYTP